MDDAAVWAGGGVSAVRAARNKTLHCSAEEKQRLRARVTALDCPASVGELTDRLVCGNVFAQAAFLPEAFVDLLFLDPPYNLSKNFHGRQNGKCPAHEYAAWFEEMLTAVRHVLTPEATVYVCADWETSMIIAPVLQRFFVVRNRISWERGKGRGARANWKNNVEDIWFCTVGARYYFDVEAVKMKRRVIAPYRAADGTPKDWRREPDGDYRLTHPSNVWTDISIPFWSMAENTDHPTQKPEKLLAKLLLASSRCGDVVFDPFAGSGTAAVAAKKLRRRFLAVEVNEEYCCWAAKRLEMAEADGEIQGYRDGVFWERNSLPAKRGAVRNGGAADLW